MKKISLLLFLTCIASVFLSCNKEDDKNLLSLSGTIWVYSSKENIPLEEIVFLSNQDYKLTVFTPNPAINEGPYTYFNNDVTLYFFDTVPIIGTVEGNCITFNYGEEKIFQRQYL